MAIPLQTRAFWQTMSRLMGTPIFQRPAGDVRAAAEKRKRLMTLPGLSLAVGRTHPDVLVSDKSAGALPIRVYRPAGTIDEQLPIVMHFHGGGWVAGEPRAGDWWCSEIAYAARVVIVSVDYRLAPEHPYPTPVEDCYAATVWTQARASDLGADGSRLAVMGDSAGGNIAAAVTLMARDRTGPAISFQVLVYPAVELLDSFASEDENEFAPMLGKADLKGACALYCPDEADRLDPCASPLRAPSHEQLPPALIQTAQHDPLRDQGSAYAAALRAGGVPVRLSDYVDGVHGYISIPGVVPCARQAVTEATSALREAFGDTA